ncbi:AsnC family transcriptional regulator [Tenacibaculum sp. SZ-18]|nr:AsnC family transcriptional regulator [Tenacibaculum sp. SZ-18]
MNQLKNQFDYIDKQILSQLRKDARKAFSQIAEELNVSNSLIHQRIKKLTSEGVIKNAEFVLDERKLGYKTKSYTGIRLREARFAKEVMRELKKIDEIVECNFVSGNYAIFILIYAKDNEHLQKILYDKVHLINGVAGTDTFICFDTCFKRSSPIE